MSILYFRVIALLTSVLKWSYLENHTHAQVQTPEPLTNLEPQHTHKLCNKTIHTNFYIYENQNICIFFKSAKCPLKTRSLFCQIFTFYSEVGIQINPTNILLLGYKEASHPVTKNLLQDEQFPENFYTTWMTISKPPKP